MGSNGASPGSFTAYNKRRASSISSTGRLERTSRLTLARDCERGAARLDEWGTIPVLRSNCCDLGKTNSRGRLRGPSPARRFSASLPFHP
jgi:hypothetical protein